MIDPRALERNITRAYVFQALVNASLWMPIWVVFLNTDRHLTLGEVYLIAGAGWVIQALAEVPTGALSDTYGRRAVLVLGGLTLAAGLGLLALLDTFAGLLIAYLLWAAGNALISGTDTALMYDSAVALGREDAFPAMASNSFQILLAAQAAGSVVGGLLGALDLRLPILMTALLTIAGVAVALAVVEPPRSMQGHASWTDTMRTAAGYLRARPRLLALVAYAAVLSGTAFFVPFVLFQPAMQEQGVAVGWLGLLFTALRLAALAGSRYGPRLIADRHTPTWLWLTPGLLLLGFVAVALSPRWWLTFAAMLFIAAVNAAIRPALTSHLNRNVSGAIRATVNSFQSLLMTVFIAAMHPAVGAVADAFTTPAAFAFLALLCFLPIGLSLPAKHLLADHTGSLAQFRNATVPNDREFSATTDVPGRGA